MAHQGGAKQVQLDLILDYHGSVALYLDFQAHFRACRPPETGKRDIPNADVRFLDTEHFALETHAARIGDDPSAPGSAARAIGAMTAGALHSSRTGEASWRTR